MATQTSNASELSTLSIQEEIHVKAPLDALWQVCPHCATPVRAELPALEDLTRGLPAPPRRREISE